MNDWKIAAGNVPPATGWPCELGLHRLELVRVADPDRDRVLRRPADEPGVAVALGRAGLAGHDHVADLRVRAGAERTTPCSSEPTCVGDGVLEHVAARGRLTASSPFGSSIAPPCRRSCA